MRVNFLRKNRGAIALRAGRWAMISQNSLSDAKQFMSGIQSVGINDGEKQINSIAGIFR
jgi:hypothetical protein